MKTFRILALVVLLFVASCGYHVPGQGDGWVGREGRSLKIALFQNQTSEPYLENVLKDELVKVFSTSRLVELTEQESSADLLMRGEVVEFESRPLAYDSRDEVSEFYASMSVRAVLLNRSSGEVYWQQTLSRSETFDAFGDKNVRQEAQSLASREVSRRLAEDIYARLLVDF